MALIAKQLARLIIPTVSTGVRQGKQFSQSLTSLHRIHSLSLSTGPSKAKESPSSSQIPALDNGLSLTPSCIKRLHEISSTDEPYLRVSISGGGCSGFQYEFSMDSVVGPDDRFIGDEKGTPLVVVDATSLSYITGSTIDYYEELIRSGFRIISNPQADGGCSCGASFSIKL